MKRIGIITFHRANSYGAQLQAYALQRKLNEDYSAEIIDYRNKYFEIIYHNGEKQKLRRRIKNQVFIWLNINDAKKYAYRNALFDKFSNKYCKKSCQYNSENVHCANKNYDCIVSGSDQVWNIEISKNDWNYYLEFVSPEKRYSYAASFGKTPANKDSDRIRDNLQMYRSILVREHEGIEIVKQLDNSLCANEVCDPVFLLSKEEWINNLDINIKKKKKGYILLFFVAPQTHAIDVAKKIAQIKDLDIYQINPFGCKEFSNGVRKIISAGPKEFLEYIANADLVITTSFHAMALSIIFNVPFFYELNKAANNVNSRLVNLAEIFSSQEREILGDFIPDTGDIKWDSINERISKYSKESYDLLRGQLGEG